MEETIEHRLQPHRLAAAFSLGTSVALLLTTPVIWPGPTSVSPGWFGLWLASTLGTAPLGFMLLAAPSWRRLPIEGRRGPALAYLTACFLDLLALAALLVSVTRVGTFVCLPAGFALAIAVLFIRLYPASAAKTDDLFP